MMQPAQLAPDNLSCCLQDPAPQTTGAPVLTSFLSAFQAQGTCYKTPVMFTSASLYKVRLVQNSIGSEP
eukprot:4985379-Pyramimonas_sp.AAC.1